MFTRIVRSLVPALLLSLSACASSPHHESTGEFFNNSMITARVRSKLVDDPLTGIFHIKVNSYKGVVELSGIVRNRTEKQRAEVIAYSVEGVKKVDNGLQVTPAQQ